MFTVRRIVQGEGVERKFPLHSPQDRQDRGQASGVVRRAKLYYLRDRVGKAVRLKERHAVEHEERGEETATEVQEARNLELGHGTCRHAGSRYWFNSGGRGDSPYAITNNPTTLDLRRREHDAAGGPGPLATACSIPASATSAGTTRRRRRRLVFCGGEAIRSSPVPIARVPANWTLVALDQGTLVFSWK